jgi:LemA protein
MPHSAINLPLIALGIVALLVVVWIVANYNRFVSVRQHLRESWGNIDVELKRRYELIPNLVETVKGYAAHEQQVLQEVIALRNRALAQQGSPAARAPEEAALQHGVRKLFAVVEGYPALRADAHFRALQEELALTEDRIAAARRFFNGNVRELNQLCDAFPSNLLAQAFGIERSDYFELPDDAQRVVPQTRFTSPSG